MKSLRIALILGLVLLIGRTPSALKASTADRAGAPGFVWGSASAVLARGLYPRTSGEPLARPLAPNYSAIIKEYRAAIPKLMEEKKIPGLSLALVETNTLVWSQGFGFTDRDRKIAVTPDTIFSLQSMSKTFTTTAILMAVESGLLDLEAPISAYLPGFRIHSRFEEFPESKITLKHLLSHMAGLTHEAPVGNNFDPSCPSFEAHIESISDTWLRWPVGERYKYSNLGIDLAGYILQTFSKQPFPAVMNNRLLTPLGMTHSSYDMDTIKKNANRAIGHQPGFSRIPLDIPMVPSGGLYASARDVAKFIQFHLAGGRVRGKALLGDSLLKEMVTVPFPVKGQTEGYALGLDSKKDQKYETLYFNHSGGGFGFLCTMVWYPEFGLGIVILTNSTNHDLAYLLAREILDKAILIKSPNARKFWEPLEKSEELPLSPGAAFLRRYVGNYVGRGDELNVVFEGSSLRLPKPIAFISENEAFDGNARYRFVMTPEGRPSHIVRIADGMTWDYNDGPDDPAGPDKPEWEKYPGRYAVKFAGQGAGFKTVSRKNGYLYIDKLKTIEHSPDLFFTSTGEALIFQGDILTLGNIRGEKIR
jgi:CubicO group peptidase (beta-lactamase class C family)